MWRSCVYNVNWRRLCAALPRYCFGPHECRCGALSADGFLAHDALRPRHDHPDSTGRTRSDSAVKDDERAEHIIRSSILKLLLEDESGSADSSPQHAVETSLGVPLNDIWAFRSKASGAPPLFKA